MQAAPQGRGITFEEGLNREPSATYLAAGGKEWLGPEWAVGQLKVCCPALQKVQLATPLQDSEQILPSSPQPVTGVLDTGSHGLKGISVLDACNSESSASPPSSLEAKLGGMRWGKLKRAELLPPSAVCFQKVTKLSKLTTAETGSVASASLPSSWSDPHLKWRYYHN